METYNIIVLCNQYKGLVFNLYSFQQIKVSAPVLIRELVSEYTFKKNLKFVERTILPSFNRAPPFGAPLFLGMTRPVGLEPTTSGFGNLRSTN